MTNTERMIQKLAEKLEKNCPDNDCRVYLNIHNMMQELKADEQVVKNETSKRALRKEAGIYRSKLTDMYFENYAIQKFQKENK